MPVEIKDFAEALAQREGRELMPTGMSAEQLREVETAVRERSVFSARVMNAEFLERVRVITEQIVAGNLGENKARLLLGQYLDSIEYHARPGTEGTIQDLRTDARLNLIVRTQVNMAYGYGKWRGRQVQSVLDEYPCLEFYRAFDRKEPRDWPARWLEAGGQFYEGDSDYPEGRMIAPQNDLIWTAISAFGTPYAPFDYNSGMDTELVTRAEAIALGAWTENDRVYPAQRGFETDAGASVRDLSPEMAQVLEETLGDGYDLSDGIIQRANELAANSFEGHEGRPGERGGSLPRGGVAQTETPEFKEWFGDSKVVDKNGKPKLMFNGSAGEFEVFKNNSWFTDDESYAQQHANSASARTGLPPKLIKVYLSIKNPVPVGISGSREEMKAAGYDGVEIERGVWSPMEPTQIKSAIGNKGTWSKTDPSIVNELPDTILQIANEMGIRQLENSMVIEELFANVHVESYTRTGPHGQPVFVSEHEDSRTKKVQETERDALKRLLVSAENNPREIRIAIDGKTGAVLAEVEGKKGTGEFNTPAETAEWNTDEKARAWLNGSQVIDMHTHPQPIAPSDGDWRVFSFSNIQKMVIVEKGGRVWEMEKTPVWESLRWQDRTPRVVGETYNSYLDKLEGPELIAKPVEAHIVDANYHMAKMFGVKLTERKMP